MDPHRDSHGAPPTRAHPTGLELSLVWLILVLAPLLVALAAPAAAGAAAQREWARGTAFSAGADRWTHVAKGPSGTVYVAGWGNIESLSERAIVAKYTASGRRVWLRSYAGIAGTSCASGIAVDSKGNAFVIGGERYPETIESHLFVMKLDGRTGKRVWIRRYDGPPPFGHDFANSIALGPKRAVYVSGTTTTADSGFDALLVKYVDKGGSAARSWVRTYRRAASPPLSNGDFSKRVLVDPDGRVYWAGTSETAPQTREAFVRRLTPAGKKVWSRRVLGSEAAVRLDLVDMELFPSGGVVVAMQRSPVAGTGFDVLVRRYTARGGTKFFHTLAAAHDEVVRDLAVDGKGNIAVAGDRRDAGDGVVSAWVARGDALFASPWQRVFASPSGGEPAVFNAVIFGAGGAVYCAGQSNTGFITGKDFTMVKYSSTGVRRWVDAYDDKDANRPDECRAVLYVGGTKPGLYGAGDGGATDGGQALLVKYVR
jgi:hypothetical protein